MLCIPSGTYTVIDWWLRILSDIDLIPGIQITLGMWLKPQHMLSIAPLEPRIRLSSTIAPRRQAAGKWWHHNSFDPMSLPFHIPLLRDVRHWINLALARSEGLRSNLTFVKGDPRVTRGDQTGQTVLYWDGSSSLCNTNQPKRIIYHIEVLKTEWQNRNEKLKEQFKYIQTKNLLDSLDHL